MVILTLGEVAGLTGIVGATSIFSPGQGVVLQAAACAETCTGAALDVPQSQQATVAYGRHRRYENARTLGMRRPQSQCGQTQSANAAEV